MHQKPTTTKAKRRAPVQDDPEQSKRFLEAARKAEADETPKGADVGFKKYLDIKKKPGK